MKFQQEKQEKDIMPVRNFDDTSENTYSEKSSEHVLFCQSRNQSRNSTPTSLRCDVKSENSNEIHGNVGVYAQEQLAAYKARAEEAERHLAESHARQDYLLKISMARLEEEQNKLAYSEQQVLRYKNEAEEARRELADTQARHEYSMQESQSRLQELERQLAYASEHITEQRSQSDQSLAHLQSIRDAAVMNYKVKLEEVERKLATAEAQLAEQRTKAERADRKLKASRPVFADSVKAEQVRARAYQLERLVNLVSPIQQYLTTLAVELRDLEARLFAARSAWSPWNDIEAMICTVAGMQSGVMEISTTVGVGLRDLPEESTAASDEKYTDFIDSGDDDLDEEIPYHTFAEV
jgi:chromosome segregation ATPase